MQGVNLDFKGALNTAELMPDTYLQAIAKHYIAVAMADHGDISGALAVVPSIPVHCEDSQGKALAGIAAAQARAGDMAGAWKTIQRMDGMLLSNRNWAYTEVAIEKLWAGDEESARQIVLARLQAPELSDKGNCAACCADCDPLDRALEEIARYQLGNGNFQGAVETSSHRDFVSRGEAFRVIAAQQILGRPEQEVLSWIDKEANPYSRSCALLGLAQGLVIKDLRQRMQ